MTKFILNSGVPCESCQGSTYLLVKEYDGVFYAACLLCKTKYPSAIDYYSAGVKSFKRKPPNIPGRYRKALGDFTECADCASTEDPQIDHIVSIYQCLREGLPWQLIHHNRNLRWLCGDCNNRKNYRSSNPDPVWQSWRKEFIRTGIQPQEIPEWDPPPAIIF